MGSGIRNESSGCSVPASRASSSSTFLKNCDGGESLGTTTCRKTVVGGKQGYAPCKILSPYDSSFLSVELNGDHKTATKMR